MWHHPVPLTDQTNKHSPGVTIENSLTKTGCTLKENYYLKFSNRKTCERFGRQEVPDYMLQCGKDESPSCVTKCNNRHVSSGLTKLWGIWEIET